MIRFPIRTANFRPGQTRQDQGLFAFGSQDTSGLATAVGVEGITAGGSQDTSGTAQPLLVRAGVQDTSGLARSFMLAAGTQDTQGLATAAGQVTSGYNFTRTFVLASHDDLSAQIIANYVLRTRITGDWLKQFATAPSLGVNLAGGEFGGLAQATVPGTFGTDYSYPLTSPPYWVGKGIPLFRVPFLLERLERVKGSLDSTEVTRITASLNAIAAAGGKVNLDCHNYMRRFDGADNREVIGLAGSSYTTANFATFWGLVAAQWKSHAALASPGGFGLMNEPSGFAGSSGLWQTNANAAIVAIRATGATNRIYCCGDSSSTASTWVSSGNATRMLTVTDSGSNLWFEAHQYFNNAGTGVYGRPAALEFSDGIVDAERAVTRLAPFLDWLDSNSRNGIIGEFGAPAGDYTGPVGGPYTLDKTLPSVWAPTILAVMRECADRGVPCYGWAGGERWSNAYELKLSPNGTVDDPALAPFLEGLAPLGHLYSHLGWDLIFETLDVPAVRMDHELEAYDRHGGAIDLNMRIPSYRTNLPFQFRAKYGSPSFS